MGLELIYRECGGTVEILRCYGECETVVLPACILGKPVTALGDYLFSREMRTEPEGLLWAEDAAIRPEGAAIRPQGEILCGSAVAEVVLPDTLKKIGRYAFYNCDGLRVLRLVSTVSDIGAGAFNGCRKITDLYVDVVSGGKSCLKEVLAELNETLTVHYRQMERAEGGALHKTGEARLLFPAFYEEAVENTPARILETHVHGCGHRYRYCFQGTEFEFREYDALFIHARTQEPPSRAAELAIGRLRYPLQLTKEAAERYGAYLMEQIDGTAQYLAGKNDMREWRWFIREFSPERAKNEHAAAGCLGNEGLAVRAREEFSDIRKPILGKTGFDKLIEVTGRLGHTEALSCLMDAAYRAYPPVKRKFEL